MKIKQILSALICTALVSAMSVQSVSAGEPVTVTEEEEVVSESSELVSEDDILDDSNIISREVVNGVTRTVRTFNWTVKAGATATEATQTALHAGDYYYFNINFSPTPSGTIKIGLYNRTLKKIYYQSSSNAPSYEKLRGITADGDYSVRIYNTTSSDIKITGKYETAEFTGGTSINVPLYTQQKSCWCWAACIQMCAKYKNYTVTQENIVKAVKGSSTDNTTATTEDYKNGMLYATNKTYKATRTFTVLPISDIKSILASKMPLMIALGEDNNGSWTDGHAVVVFAVDKDSKFIKVNDPSSTSGGVKAFKYSSITDSSSPKQYYATIKISLA